MAERGGEEREGRGSTWREGGERGWRMEDGGIQPATDRSCAWAAAAAVAIAVNGLERGWRCRSLARGLFHSAGLLWNHPRAERLVFRPGSSATSLAPICGIGRRRRFALAAPREEARPFAVDVTECGAGDYAERSVPHPRLCSFPPSFLSCLSAVGRRSFHPCSISVGRLPLLSVGLEDASQLPPSLPSFHPFPRRHQSASPPSPAVLGGCKVLLSLRRPLPSLRLLCQFMVGKEVEAAERAHQKTERAHRATSHSQLHVCGESKASSPFVKVEHPKVEHIYH